jgi:hypothetical protein
VEKVRGVYVGGWITGGAELIMHKVISSLKYVILVSHTLLWLICILSYDIANVCFPKLTTVIAAKIMTEGSNMAKDGKLPPPLR